MNRILATSLIAGGIVGITGIAMMTQDKRSQRAIMKGGRKLMNKAADVMDDITDIAK